MKKGNYLTSPKSNAEINTHEPITAIIIASHPGHRMKSYGPISLFNLGIHNLLDIQIEAIKAIHKNYEIHKCRRITSN